MHHHINWHVQAAFARLQGGWRRTNLWVSYHTMAKQVWVQNFQPTGYPCQTIWVGCWIGVSIMIIYPVLLGTLGEVIWYIRHQNYFLFPMMVIEAIVGEVGLGDVTGRRITYCHLPIQSIKNSGGVLYNVCKVRKLWSPLDQMPSDAQCLRRSRCYHLLDIMVLQFQDPGGVNLVCTRCREQGSEVWLCSFQLRSNARPRWFNRQTMSPSGWRPSWCPYM